MNGYNVTAGVVGLGTVLDVKVPDAGQYLVSGTITLPSIPAGSSDASAVVAVINKNGSPVYTGLAAAKGFRAEIACAAADEITVVLSSGAAVDQGRQAIRSTTTIGLG